MTKFRLRQVEVETISVVDALAAARGNWAALPSWLSKAFERNEVTFRWDVLVVNSDSGTFVGSRKDHLVWMEGGLHVFSGVLFDAACEEVPEGANVVAMAPRSG